MHCIGRWVASLHSYWLRPKQRKRTATGTDAGVLLAWNAVPGATQYEIQYVYSDEQWGSDWQGSIFVGVSASQSYEVSDEIGSQRYNFRVRAEFPDAQQGGNVWGPWSATVTSEAN